MLEHLSYSMLLILFFAGLVAGTIDAIAGGGGLISLPVLLGVGVPPHIALGTNKFQSSLGTSMAVRSYYRAGLINFKTLYKGLFFSFLGTVLGSVIAQLISSNILGQIIPIILVIIFLYILFSPALGLEDKTPLCGEFYFYIVFGFIMGFYDGFFGPGTGTFWLFFLSHILGYNLRKATAYTKVFNLNSNLIATTCFALGGNIDYRLAITMAIGQLLGGQVGAHLAIKKGAKLIRPVFIAVVSSTIISLFYRNYDRSNLIVRFFIEFKVMSLSLAIVMMAIVVGVYIWKVRKSAIESYN